MALRPMKHFTIDLREHKNFSRLCPKERPVTHPFVSTTKKNFLFYFFSAEEDFQKFTVNDSKEVLKDFQGNCFTFTF
jgi:hypothetical protein